MTPLTTLEQYANNLLDVASFADYAPHGIQVRGREEVRRIITGVSACQALFQAAVDQEADLILVHHGLFWDKDTRVVEGMLKNRLKRLLEHDINLMAYHLPLDAHPTLGNNIQLLNRLSLKAVAPFGLYRQTHLSFIGEREGVWSLPACVARVREVLGGDPLVLPFGPERIRRVAVCSGAAPELVHEAKQKEADLFLTGEASEPLYYVAREAGIHCIAAGHHRTEKFGVQALGEHLADHFGLFHRFVDTGNPI